MTNNIATTNSIPYLDKVLEWNDQLLGLPALPLVVVGCIAFGYLLKAWPQFDNRKIPSWVVMAGIVLYFGITIRSILDEVRDAKTVAENAVFMIGWSFRTAVLGLIAGFVAIAVHRVFLKKIEEKYGWFSGNTAFFKKPVEEKKEETKP